MSCPAKFCLLRTAAKIRRLRGWCFRTTASASFIACILSALGCPLQNFWPPYMGEAWNSTSCKPSGSGENRSAISFSSCSIQWARVRRRQGPLRQNGPALYRKRSRNRPDREDAWRLDCWWRNFIKIEKGPPWRSPISRPGGRNPLRSKRVGASQPRL